MIPTVFRPVWFKVKWSLPSNFKWLLVNINFDMPGHKRKICLFYVYFYKVFPYLNSIKHFYLCCKKNCFKMSLDFTKFIIFPPSSSFLVKRRKSKVIRNFFSQPILLTILFFTIFVFNYRIVIYFSMLEFLVNSYSH